MHPFMADESDRYSSLLLTVFLAVSFTIHLLFLTYFSESLTGERTVYLELSLHSTYEAEPLTVEKPQFNTPEPLREDIPKPARVTPARQPRRIPGKALPLPAIHPVLEIPLVASERIPANSQHAEEIDSSDTAAAIRKTYFHKIRERINGFKTYPEGASSRNPKGNVRVHFRLHANGTLSEVRATGSSSRIFKHAAVESVLLAAPFPQFPPELGDDSIPLHIDMRFTIKP